MFTVIRIVINYFLFEVLMEIFYPDYYSEFICTADNCPLTCCQEWKIYVDDSTKEKWKTLTPPESAGGHKKNLNSFTEKKKGPTGDPSD